MNKSEPTNQRLALGLAEFSPQKKKKKNDCLTQNHLFGGGQGGYIKPCEGKAILLSRCQNLFVYFSCIFYSLRLFLYFLLFWLLLDTLNRLSSSVIARNSFSCVSMENSIICDTGLLKKGVIEKKQTTDALCEKNECFSARDILWG